MDDHAVDADEVLLGANGSGAASADAKLTPQLAITEVGEFELDTTEQRAGRRRGSLDFIAARRWP